MANPQHIEWLREGVEAWNNRRRADRFQPDLSGTKLDNEVASSRMFRFIPDDSIPGNKYMTQFQGLDLNGADLSNTEIEAANFRDANLNGANLEGARLYRVSFRNATMHGVRLNLASISETYFQGADLTWAKFVGTEWTNADLSEADLSNAQFSKNSNLFSVHVHNTNLTETELTGITYLPMAFNTAKLSSGGSPSQHDIGSPTIDSVPDFLRILEKIYRFYDDGDVECFFRGEPQCGNELRPSVMRTGAPAKSESRMLVDLISRRPEDFSGATSALDQWMLAQHHRLKTRFLDITKNSLAGLFFACDSHPNDDGQVYMFATPRSIIMPFTSDSISVIANFAKLSHDDQMEILFPTPHITLANFGTRWEGDETLTLETMPGTLLPPMRRLYQSIRVEKPYFEERIDPRDFYRVLVVKPQMSSERIRAQSGAFLVSAFHRRFERDEVLRWKPDVPIYALYQLTVSAARKRALRRELETMGITRESLFPGLESASLAIIDQDDTDPCDDSALMVYKQAAGLEEQQRVVRDLGLLEASKLARLKDSG